MPQDYLTWKIWSWELELGVKISLWDPDPPLSIRVWFFNQLLKLFGLFVVLVTYESVNKSPVHQLKHQLIVIHVWDLKNGVYSYVGCTLRVYSIILLNCNGFNSLVHWKRLHMHCVFGKACGYLIRIGWVFVRELNIVCWCIFTCWVERAN